MTERIEISERAHRLLQNQQNAINAMIAGIREAMDVPQGWQLSIDGKAFVAPSAQQEDEARHVHN